jgi:hypothetical protein
MPDELTRSQSVSKPIRSSRSRDALDGLPAEKFFRIVGLFNAVVPIDLKSKNTGGNYENPVVQEFETLRSLIEQKLRDRDVVFQRDEMGDYVHNLNLLLGQLLPLEALESAMPSLRDDYRMRVGAEVYAAYIASPPYKALESCDGADKAEVRLRFLRADYIQLVNEVRRLILLDYHIVETRNYLVRKLRSTLYKVIIAPAVIVLLFFVVRAATLEVETSKAPSRLSVVVTSYLIRDNDAKTTTVLYNALVMLTLLSLAAIAGAVGSFVSALLRIEAVPENTEIARNVVALRYSESIRLAPVTGLIFAILLSLVFGGKLLNGLLFPDTGSNSRTWPFLLFVPSELAKWLVWAFIAGFSERLMPDMLDRLVDRAGKSDKGASPPPGPTGPRAIVGTRNGSPEKPDANGAQGKAITKSGETDRPAVAPAVPGD